MNAPPSHFQRLGFAPAPELDVDQLERRYLELTRKHHPDRLVGASPTEQRKALILSSHVNEAYRVLSDRRLRFEHLLELAGGKNATQDKRTPQAFLIEHLELREEVEAAQARGDETALAAFRARAEDERAGCLTRAQAHFDREDFPTPELLAAIREELNVVKYWVSLAEELRAAPALPA